MDARKALSWAKSKFLPKATAILKSPERLKGLVFSVEEKIDSDYFKKQFQGFWEDLKTLLALLKDTAKGQYKPSSKKMVVLMVLGLLYFLNPMDLIPDLLVGGFIDDAALLSWILTRVKEELEIYKSSLNP